AGAHPSQSGSARGTTRRARTQHGGGFVGPAQSRLGERAGSAAAECAARAVSRMGARVAKRSAPRLATTWCRGQLGLAAPLIEVQVYLGSGLPTFSIVGLAAAAVRESKERVRAALEHSGFPFPAGRITVNLAPADLPKDGGRFDLPIAIGILLASGQLPAPLQGTELYGELSLSGELRPVRG